MVNIGRKFTSQTSENMDRWKSRGGKRQRSEEKKREDQRRKGIRCEKEEEKGSEKKMMQVREKVEKPRFTAFFLWFVWLRTVEK
jgi:hypothetical protein